MIQGFGPLSSTVRKWNVEEFQPYNFIKKQEYHITVPIKKGSRQYERFASD